MFYKEENVSTVEKVNWCDHDGEWRRGVLEKLNLGLPYDPEILLLGTCLERTIIQKDVCTPMFIVKPWKQTIYPSTDEWMKM